jgi:outer membrane protein assembly factor BamB
VKRTLVLFLLILVPAAVLILGAGALRLWLESGSRGVTPRVPVNDAYDWGKEIVKGPSKQVNTGTLIRGTGAPSDDPGSWPQFRGSDRTNVAPPEEKLLANWPATGPQVLWKLDLGEGHAGAAVRGGRVFLIDYDRDKKEDAVRCLSLADGKEIWRYTYYVPVKRYHGMSRTVPAVTDDFVVTLGPKGHVTCLRMKTGELVWKMDLVKDYGATIPEWYAGQCPLIDGDRAILAPGGKALMLAVSLATGQVVWQTPNPSGWGMTHASIVAMDYRGKRQYIYCATLGVAGVSASDGALLWKTAEWTVPTATVASPVVVDADRIFFSGGYNSGAAMFRLTGEGADIRPELVYRLKYDVFGAPQHTPILYNGHIYGIIQNGELVCLGLDGKRVWASGSANRFGLGPFLIADGSLLVLSDMEGTAGTLFRIEAGTQGYRELAKAKVIGGRDAWGPMALANGKLLLRDRDRMVCVAVGTRSK